MVEAAYTVTGPASGEVRRTAVVRVTLGEAVHPARAVRFTPSDSSGDGVFTPASIDLSDSVRSGSFSYTPDRWGKRTITIANDGGLGGSGSMLEFVAKVQLGSSGTAPSGNRGPDLGGFDFFARGPWWRELGRSVLDDRGGRRLGRSLEGLRRGQGPGRLGDHHRPRRQQQVRNSLQRRPRQSTHAPHHRGKVWLGERSWIPSRFTRA